MISRTIAPSAHSIIDAHMNKNAFVACMLIGISGCTSYNVKQHPDLTVVLYNGDGKDVEVTSGDDKIVSLHDIKTDENNVAAVEKIRRVPGILKFTVKVNGVTAGRFSINAQRIGVVYLFLTPDGSVILEDGMRSR